MQPTTIIADRDFPVLKAVEELEQERERRLRSVPAVVVRDDSSSVAAYQRLRWIREQVETLRHRGGAAASGADRGELVLSFSQPTLLALLLGPRSDDLLSHAELLVQEVMQRGYVSSDLAEELAAYPSVRITDPLGSVTMPSDQLMTADRVGELARARAVQAGLPAGALADIVLHAATPNLRLETGDTRALREEAVASVEPHIRIVRKGEKIIGAHEVITPEVQRTLRSYAYWRGQQGLGVRLWDRTAPLLGDLLLALVLIGAYVVYLWIYRRPLLMRPVDFWLLFVNLEFVLLLAAGLVRGLGLPHLLVPASSIAILVTLFFDARLAIASSLLAILLIGVVGDGGMPFVAVIGVGTLVSVLMTPSLRRRSHFYRVLGVVSGVHLVLLAGLSLADAGQFGYFLRGAIASVANPLLATAVVLLLLPISESVFHRSTDLSLLELVDLNRSALQRLMLAAPGSYHHSIMVGTLAESSAHAIGANPLLARVIGYYHDIGKVTKPDLFAENVQLGRKSPRDRLAPSMSRLILERHVREGVLIGQAERLPREVLEGIREHHGFGLMKEAYARALALDPTTPREQYCYPGPRPTTRESALVLLANQVEESSRVLDEPSPSRIKRLIHEVVQENVDNGNLDESGLTLSDLAQVRNAFLTLLVAAHRSRMQTKRERTDARSEPGEAARPTGGTRAG